MTQEELKAWCMAHPRPAMIRVTSADGAVHEVLCTGTTWPKITETIAALMPELLEAMSGEKQLIRALRPAQRSEDWGDDSAPQPSKVPPLAHIPITASDPETQRFALVAQLVADAYRHSNDVAFSRLAQIVDSLVARSTDVERAREQMYRAHVRQLEDQLKALGQNPTDSTDLLGAMMSQFLAGAQMHGTPAPAPPPPPPPNGVHKGKA